MYKRTLVLLFLSFFLLVPAAAHSGRTDASGGHYDSSTGEYHYHHGYSAHQHPNGICPYSNKDQTNHTSGGSSQTTSSSTPAVSSVQSDDRFDDGYYYGYADAKREFDDNVTPADTKAAYDRGKAEASEAHAAALAAQRKQLRFFYLSICAALCIMCYVILSMRSRRQLRQLNAHLTMTRRELDEQKRIAAKTQAQLTAASQTSFDQKRRSADQRRALSAQLQERSHELDSLQRELSVTRQENARLRAVLLSNAPTPAKYTFGKWPASVHQTPEQRERYRRSQTDPLHIFAVAADGSYLVEAADGTQCNTTLSNCTCPDFVKNLCGQAPCKHIYFVARHSGAPLEKIFPET